MTIEPTFTIKLTLRLNENHSEVKELSHEEICAEIANLITIGNDSYLIKSGAVEIVHEVKEFEV